jgi:hypothetical protein
VQKLLQGFLNPGREPAPSSATIDRLGSAERLLNEEQGSICCSRRDGRGPFFLRRRSGADDRMKKAQWRAIGQMTSH